MPRDINGNYTLPPQNPVTPHTLILADWANPTMTDIAAALSDSLSRTGSGGMLVPFKFADGTILNPSITWTNEPTSGWYRNGVNDFWYAIANQNIFRITANGIEIAPGKTALGIAAFINVQDTLPTPMKQGETWFESDTGMYAMNYVNPDATQSLVALAAAGGDFVPFPMKGAANGVATLDVTTKVPMVQLHGGEASGVATLDGAAKLAIAQMGSAPLSQAIATFNQSVPVPANATKMLFMLKAGGGSGACSGTGARGGTGGEGELRMGLQSVAFGQNINITIGAGGAIVAAGPNQGNAGGASQMTNGVWSVSANPGQGGTRGDFGGAPGLGGAAGGTTGPAMMSIAGQAGQCGSDATGGGIAVFNAAGGGQGGAASAQSAAANTGAGGGSGSSTVAAGAGGSGYCFILFFT